MHCVCYILIMRMYIDYLDLLLWMNNQLSPQPQQLSTNNTEHHNFDLSLILNFLCGLHHLNFLPGQAFHTLFYSLRLNHAANEDQCPA